MNCEPNRLSGALRRPVLVKGSPFGSAARLALFPGGVLSLWLFIAVMCCSVGDLQGQAQPQQSRMARAKRLLIVAPKAFHPALKEFVRYKRQLLPAELVSLEDILRRGTGVDDPEKLKRFLYDR